MFNTMQRQLNRKQPTGKALVLRRTIITSIFLLAFAAFQLIQFNKVSASLDFQYDTIKKTTVQNTEMLSGTLDKFEAKYDQFDEFFADKAFQSPPLSTRLSNNVEAESELAQQEAVQAQGSVILFDIFKWVIPGAAATTDDHAERLDDFFHGQEYRDYYTTQQKINDINTAVQYCQGELSKNHYKGSGYATKQEMAAWTKSVKEAADRTLCDSIQ